MAEEIQNKTSDAPAKEQPKSSGTGTTSSSTTKTGENRGDSPNRRSDRPVRNNRPQRRGRGNKPFYAKKVCRFCTKQIDEKGIDYKNIDLMRRYVMPSGKIVPRRINGNCAKHQRRITAEVKKARILALLPFMDR